MHSISQAQKKELRGYFDISNITISKNRDGFIYVDDYYQHLQTKYELETNYDASFNIHQLFSQNKKPNQPEQKQPEQNQPEQKQPEQNEIKTMIFSMEEFKSICQKTDDELFNKDEKKQEQNDKPNLHKKIREIFDNRMTHDKNEMFANGIIPKNLLIKTANHKYDNDTEYVNKRKELEDKLIDDTVNYIFNTKTNKLPFYVLLDKKMGICVLMCQVM